MVDPIITPAVVAAPAAASGLSATTVALGMGGLAVGGGLLWYIMREKAAQAARARHPYGVEDPYAPAPGQRPLQGGIPGSAARPGGAQGRQGPSDVELGLGVASASIPLLGQFASALASAFKGGSKKPPQPGDPNFMGPVRPAGSGLPQSEIRWTPDLVDARQAAINEGLTGLDYQNRGLDEGWISNEEYQRYMEQHGDTSDAGGMLWTDEMLQARLAAQDEGLTGLDYQNRGLDEGWISNEEYQRYMEQHADAYDYGYGPGVEPSSEQEYGDNTIRAWDDFSDVTGDVSQADAEQYDRLAAGGFAPTTAEDGGGFWDFLPW